MNHRIRVLLADDHAVLRAGLRALLSNRPDMEVVGEAGDGEAAVRQVKGLRPDVVVMDISMPGVGGLDATREIARLGLGTRVLVLTMHDEDQSTSCRCCRRVARAMSASVRRIPS